MKLDIKSLINKNLLSFSLYDFANSAYVLMFNSYLFPLFFRENVFRNSKEGDFYWGLSVSISVLLGVIISPFVGYVADNKKRKKILSIFVFFVVAGVFSLSVVGAYSVYSKFVIILLFVLTNASFVVTLSVYDSFLPHISERENRSLVSSIAWGFGYLGGVICFLLYFIMKNNYAISSQDGLFIVGLFYLIFSFISLILLPDSVVRLSKSRGFVKVLSKSITKNIIIILISFWLLNDAIDTIIHFASIYGKYSLGINTEKIGILMLVLQLIAFPATILMGLLSRYIGEKKVIIISLLIWVIIISTLMTSKNYEDMVRVVVLTGFVIGSSQSLMRSYYSGFFEKESSGFAYGMYSIVSRASALLGPIIFGFTSAVYSQSIAMITILIPLVVGGVMFSFFVNNQES